MWELGLNFTQVQNTPAMTDLVTFKWPLLSCPEQFAHPETDLEHKMASHVFDPSQQGKSCDPTKGDPKICLLNPVRLATPCVSVVVTQLRFFGFLRLVCAGAAGLHRKFCWAFAECAVASRRQG